MIVALAALFVALGGAGVAATGGNFILGQSNSADKTTALSSGVTTGPTLELSNAGNRPAARFNAGNGAQPFIVSNGIKVANLNVDKLDGLSSESFTQGGGRLYSGHREGVSAGGTGTLVDVPGALTIKYECLAEGYWFYLHPKNLYMALTLEGSTQDWEPSPSIRIGTGGTYPRRWDLLGSRPFNRLTFEPAVLVEARFAALRNGGKCIFQAVAEVFG